jgi:ribosomal protein L22
LKNAESNAKAKNLTVEHMRITHIQARASAALSRCCFSPAAAA